MPCHAVQCSAVHFNGVEWSAVIAIFQSNVCVILNCRKALPFVNHRSIQGNINSSSNNNSSDSSSSSSGSNSNNNSCSTLLHCTTLLYTANNLTDSNSQPQCDVTLARTSVRTPTRAPKFYVVYVLSSSISSSSTD